MLILNFMRVIKISMKNNFIFEKLCILCYKYIKILQKFLNKYLEKIMQ